MPSIGIFGGVKRATGSFFGVEGLVDTTGVMSSDVGIVEGSVTDSNAVNAGAPDSRLSGGPVQPRSATSHGLRHRAQSGSLSQLTTVGAVIDF